MPLLCGEFLLAQDTRILQVARRHLLMNHSVYTGGRGWAWQADSWKAGWALARILYAEREPASCLVNYAVSHTVRRASVLMDVVNGNQQGCSFASGEPLTLAEAAGPAEAAVARSFSRKENMLLSEAVISSP